MKAMPPERTESATPEIIERPLEQTDLDRFVTDYFDDHSEYLSLLVDLGNYTEEDLTPNELTEMLDIDAERLERLGLGYYLRAAKLSDEPRLFHEAGPVPRGRLLAEHGVDIPRPVTAVDLVTLQYLMDTTEITDDVDGRRAVLMKPAGRTLEAGDACYSGNGLQRIYDAAHGKIGRIAENITVHMNDRLGECLKVLDDQPLPVREGAVCKARLGLAEILERHENVRRAILHSMPIWELHEHVKSDRRTIEALAERTGALSNDPVDDLRRFSLRGFMKDHREHVVADDVQFRSFEATTAHSPLIRQDVLFGVFSDPRPMEVQRSAAVQVRELLAERVLASRPEWDALRRRYQSEKLVEGWDLSVRLEDFALMVARLGTERTDALLRGSDDIGRTLRGFGLLEQVGKVRSLDATGELEAEVGSAGRILDGGLWENLRFLSASWTRVGKYPGTPFSEPVPETDEAMDAFCYDRCRLVYERAAAAYAADPWKHSETGAVIPFEAAVLTQKIEWMYYDIDVPGVSEETIRTVLASSPVTVDTLGDHYRIAWSEEHGKMPEDPEERQKYLVREAVDRAAFLRDLFEQAAAHPEAPGRLLLAETLEKRQAELAEEGEDRSLEAYFTPHERTLYVIHAEELAKVRKYECLAEIATWRGSLEPEDRARFAPPAEDLDDLVWLWRIAEEGPQGQSRYYQAVEALGHRIVRNYVCLFNSPERRRPAMLFPLTDRLKWTAYLDRVTKSEMVSLLGAVDRHGDHRHLCGLLAEYDPERDPLRDRGPIDSLRTLRSRVTAIRSGLDINRLPGEWNVLLDAPGFDFEALKDMMHRPEFRELREGGLDREQPYPATSRPFLPERPLTEAVSAALGSQREGRPGAATRPKRLFHELKHLLAERRPDLQVGDLCRDVPEELTQPVLEAVRRFEARPEAITGPVLQATLHDKSDPEGWVCGNYTDCCMPFGRSTNNDYMTNPRTQYFTVKYRGRVIAQSVVIQSERISDGVPAIVLDSIEIAKKYAPMLPQINASYRGFWNGRWGQPILVGANDPAHPMTGERADGTALRETYRPLGPVDYTDSWNYHLFPFGGSADEGSQAPAA
ncbi:MAG: hypothetical protein WD603_01575 [Patescibacteria group bacterium]